MSAPAKPLAFEYDTSGRVTKATDTVNVSFGYDGTGRLASVSASDGPGVTYAYDGAMVTSESSTAPSSHSVGYAYDSLLRPVSQSIDGANALAVTYDKDGLLTAVGALTLSRGVSTGVISSTSLSGGTVETRTYDGYGVLASQNDASGVYQVAYDREVGGRVHEKTETLGGATHTTRYEYDVAGRLYRVFIDGAGTPAYEYTYTGNGSRASATVDAQDRTVSYGGATYTYGPNGERATKTVAGATTTYVYDARGNLREVTTPSTTVEYVVDGLGRRVGKKVAGSLERGWVWSGNQLVAEVNAAGAVTKRFVYATGRTAPDYMVEGANTYRVVSDQLGSVRAVLDAAGSVVLSIDYDPYGKESAVTGSRSLLPFGFAGGLSDPATGLIRFGARDYDPELGAWTSKDPSRFAGGLNLYVYAHNDPVNFIDASGLAPSSFDTWLFELEDNGTLDVVAGVGTGLLDNIPITVVPFGPTLGDVVSWLGLSGKPHKPSHASPCAGDDADGMSAAEKGRLAGSVAGALVLGLAKGGGAKFNPDQQALIKLAREGQRTGITATEADTLIEWAREYGLSARNDIGTNHWVGGDHIHVGPINHIPVR